MGNIIMSTHLSFPIFLHISPYCWCTLFSPRSTSPSVPTSLGFPLRSRFRKTRHSHHRRIPSPKCHSWGHTRHLRCRSPQKSAERVQFPGPNFCLSLSLCQCLCFLCKAMTCHDQGHDSNLQYEKYKMWIGPKRLGNNRLTKHPHNTILINFMPCLGHDAYSPISAVSCEPVCHHIFPT